MNGLFLLIVGRLDFTKPEMISRLMEGTYTFYVLGKKYELCGWELFNRTHLYHGQNKKILEHVIDIAKEELGNTHKIVKDFTVILGKPNSIHELILDTEYWKSKHKGISLKWTQIPDGIQALQGKIQANKDISFEDLQKCISQYCKHQGNYTIFANRRDESFTQSFYTILQSAQSYHEVQDSDIFNKILENRKAYYQERVENAKALYINPGIH